MKPEAIVFDWGGTLSDFASIELEDMWRLAARHLAQHLEQSEDQITAALTDVERGFWQRTATHQRAGALPDLFADATARLGVDVAEAVLEEAALHYLDAWTPHVRHDPDAAATLSALRERGLRLGLLSNTHWPRSFHEHFLARDGLGQLLDHRCYTSEMTYMKPHPEAFRHVLDALGVDSPAAAVMVGDRPFDDIFGGKQFGMRTVHRPNDQVPAYDVEPDATINSLPELLTWVDRWSS